MTPFFTSGSFWPWEVDAYSKMANYPIIGEVRSNFEKPADPDQMRRHESTLVIYSKYEKGLFGVETNDYLQVIFQFHLSYDYTLKGRRRGGNVRGVFASRSPNRPSPIGVTTVKLLEREGRKLLVLGLDAVDGTPLLDIKPYAESMDAAACFE